MLSGKCWHKKAKQVKNSNQREVYLSPYIDFFKRNTSLKKYDLETLKVSENKQFIVTCHRERNQRYQIRTQAIIDKVQW